MFKKVELWVVALLCVLFLIVLICYGGIIRYQYNGGKGFPLIRKTAFFLADIPANIKEILFFTHNLIYLDDISNLLIYVSLFTSTLFK